MAQHGVGIREKSGLDLLGMPQRWARRHHVHDTACRR